MNRETAITEAGLNRVDQFTPQGSLTWTQNGTWADGTPRFQQTMQYSPEQQKLYDQQNQIAQALGGTAQGALGRADAAMSQGLDFSGFQPLQGVNFGQTPQLQTSLPNAGGIQSTFGIGGPLTSNVQQTQFQNQIANAGNIQNSFNGSGPLTTGVNQSQLQDQIANAGNIRNTFGMGGPLTSNVSQSQFRDQIAGAGEVTRQAGGDFNETSRAAADAVFNQLASRLNPQYQQLEADMRNRLINSGITENSEAFRREMDNFARQRTDAFNTAGNQSVLTGLTAQQQGFGQSLANAQLNNQAQGQIFGQNAAQLDAFNNARNMEFAQAMANAGLNNQAQGQQFQQNMNAAGFANQAQNQQFQQNAAQLDAFNNARTTEFAQAMANAGLNNQAQGQQFQQNMGQAAFNNAAQDQQFQQNTAQLNAFNTAQQNQFTQGMANAGLNNQAQGQQFNQNMGAAAFGNAAQEQQFGQNLAGANFGNTSRMAQEQMNRQGQVQSAAFNNDVRQRQIEEAAYLRNLPLNDIAALLGTGGGVQAPTFGSFSQSSIQSPDYMNAVYNTFNAQQQQWQQQQQARSQGLGSIFGLLGTVGGAVISDRRKKTAIEHVGKLANGIATYTFKYIGDSVARFGVMAQEVLDIVPDAVGTLSDGTLYVDYRKIGL